MRARANEFGASRECFCLTRTTCLIGSIAPGGAHVSPKKTTLITCNSHDPGVWRCQVEPKSDLYVERTGKLMDPEKVVKGKLTELKTHE